MITVGWLASWALLASACAERSLVATAERPPEAWAELRNAQGESVGSAVLRDEGRQVRIVVHARGLTPGPHGIHVHAVGRCEPPTFASAGDHLNPAGKKHGLENPEGPHGGDLPNAEADASGNLEYLTATDRLTLRPGPNSIFDADGSAVVVHARADDQRTDPAGNAGDRILCGQVVARPAIVAARP